MNVFRCTESKDATVWGDGLWLKLWDMGGRRRI